MQNAMDPHYISYLNLLLPSAVMEDRSNKSLRNTLHSVNFCVASGGIPACQEASQVGLEKLSKLK